MALADLTAAAVSLRLRVASHGYLAEARRQNHRALCPAHNLENIPLHLSCYAASASQNIRVFLPGEQGVSIGNPRDPLLVLAT
jgi:hypothetical protein